MNVAITGLGLYLPGFPSVASWVAGTPDPEAPKPKGLALDRINRRRAGVLGRAVADSAAEAMTQAGADPSEVSTVVGSSIGEASTMVGLLEQMWRDKTPMSPAAFTVSVHNAASGLLSISSKNQGYVTSLAADEDTPAAALLEGIGLVHHKDAPVLVVCSDEPAPLCLVDDNSAWGMLSAAVVLAPSDSSSNALAQIEVVQGAKANLPAAEVDLLTANNPQAGMVDLVDAILKGNSGTLALDRGTGRGYCAQLEIA